MELGKLIFIVAVVVIVLILILFPEARKLLSGFTRLFIKDMATTPEGAEAIYEEKIDQAQESYNKADNAYKIAAGKLSNAQKDLDRKRKRLINVEAECESLVKTNQIELARTLPGEILKEAHIPVEGLTVKDGIPLIHGLPVSNLSEGEKLSLCVDVAISKPNALQIILIDGAEKLSEDNRKALYEKCKEKGLQFIATRTTDDDCLEVTAL